MLIKILPVGWDTINYIYVIQETISKGPTAAFHLAPLRSGYFIITWLVARISGLDGFGIERFLPAVFISILVAEVYFVALKLTNHILASLIAAGQFMLSYYAYRLFIDLHSALFGYVILLLWYQIYISHYPKGIKRVAILSFLLLLVALTYPVTFLIAYAIILFDTVSAIILQRKLVNKLEQMIQLLVPVILVLVFVVTIDSGFERILHSLFRGPDYLAPFPSDPLHFYLYLGQDSWLYALIVPFVIFGLYEAVKHRFGQSIIWATTLLLMIASAYYMNTTFIPERIILFFPSYLFIALAAKSLLASTSLSISRVKGIREVRIRLRKICCFVTILALLLVTMVVPYNHARENISKAPVYINQALVEKLNSLQLFIQSKGLAGVIVIADLGVVGLSFSLINNTILAVIRSPAVVYFGKFYAFVDRSATRYDIPVFNYISEKSLTSVLGFLERILNDNQTVIVATFPEIYNLKEVPQCSHTASFCVLGYLP